MRCHSCGRSLAGLPDHHPQLCEILAEVSMCDPDPMEEIPFPGPPPSDEELRQLDASITATVVPFRPILTVDERNREATALCAALSAA